MREVLEVLAAAGLLVGCSLSLLAAVGLHRFPDVFARMHAATKPATLGLLLVVLAIMLRVQDAGDVLKLLLVAVLQFLTVPAGAHLVGRAAYRSGTELDPGTSVDELAEADSVGAAQR